MVGSHFCFRAETKLISSQAPLNLKLAQRHYQARVLELRNLISIEEANFK